MKGGIVMKIYRENGMDDANLATISGGRTETQYIHATPLARETRKYQKCTSDPPFRRQN
jgi:hypothetical protein